MVETMQNLELQDLRKKRITIDGDPNRVLELNTSDLTVIHRLNDLYPKLKELEDKASSVVLNKDDDNVIQKSSELLKEIDSEMRGYIDEIFNANVCEVCVPDGSMYDPHNGRLTYEIVVEAVAGLYDDNITAEIKKLNARVQKHTAKYVPTNATKSRKK